MRHGKMKEPWFMKSSAIPKWVREYEERGEPHYLDKDIKDKHSQYRDTQKDVSGEELFVRFMDQIQLVKSTCIRSLVKNFKLCKKCLTVY